MAVRVQAVTATAAVLAVSVAIAAQTPTTHRFMPERFLQHVLVRASAGAEDQAGDRVITKTIDAGGVDWNGKQVAQGPNPQTGPFYIEGAEPGDAIVVTIERIETNRATGFSASLLAPYAVDPASLAARVEREPRRVTWIIDKAKGIDATRCGGYHAGDRVAAAADARLPWRPRRPAKKQSPRAPLAPSAATWTTRASTLASR